MMFGRGVYGGFQGGPCFGYGMYGLGSGIMMLLVVIIVGILVWQLLKKKEQPHEDVLEILKMKYINGEITEEEYLKRREVLLKK